jgi:AP-1 complex subunit gamma-1
MLGGPSSPASAPATASSASTHEAYNKNALHLSLQVSRNAEGIAQVIARFRNTDAFSRISSLNLQAAVPKTQKLQLNAISSSELEPGSEATQAMRISGARAVSLDWSLARKAVFIDIPSQPPLRLRLKIGYTTDGGERVEETVNWSEPN